MKRIHDTEVHRTVDQRDGKSIYIAHCTTCGWDGPDRTWSDAAAEDATKHKYDGAAR